MGYRVPLPPPRNQEEMEEQIKYLEGEIRFNRLMTLVLWLSAIIGAIVIASLRVL